MSTEGKLAAERHAAAHGFIDALIACDFDGLRGWLAPDVTFRALIPRGPIVATGAAEVSAQLERWFGDAEWITLIDSSVSDVGDRVAIRYRVELEEDGRRVLEQSAYADVANDQITAIDLLCSGFRPSE